MDTGAGWRRFTVQSGKNNVSTVSAGTPARIQTFINFWLTDSLAQVLTLIGVAVILFLREWRLAVLVLVPMPVVVVLTHSVWKHVRTLFRRERSEVGRFRQRSAELRDVTLRNERTWAVLTPTWTFVMRFGEFLADGYLVLGAEMKVGELVQFVQYAMISTARWP